MPPHPSPSSNHGLAPTSPVHSTKPLGARLQGEGRAGGASVASFLRQVSCVEIQALQARSGSGRCNAAAAAALPQSATSPLAALHQRWCKQECR